MNKVDAFGVWSVVNSIRGYVSVSDYPFVVLPALLLKWAELKNKEEGFEAFKEIYAPSRLAATFGTADSALDVINYLIEIEKCQIDVHGGYLSEVGKYIEQVPTKDFVELLRLISQDDSMNLSDLYDVAKELLCHASKTSGIRGPVANLSCTGVRQLERVCLGLVDSAHEVYDGFSGSGISAIDASDGNGILILKDKNAQEACISEIMCILRGCRAEISVGDSFISGDDKKYDRVVMEPPFGLKSKEYKDMMQGVMPPYFDTDGDLMCLKYAESCLKKDGIAVVLCPPGTLFRGGKAVESRKILTENCIDTVIQLPPNSVYSMAIAPALVVMKSNKDNKDVLFVDASKMFDSDDKIKHDLFLSEANLEVLRSIINNREEKPKLSRVVSLEDIEKREYSLVTAQYINANATDREIVDLKPYQEQYARILAEQKSIDGEFSKILKAYLD